MRKWLGVSQKLWCIFSVFSTVMAFLYSGCFLPSSQGVADPGLLQHLIRVGILLSSSVVGSISSVCCCKSLERLMFWYEAHLLYIYFHSATNYNDKVLQIQFLNPWCVCVWGGVKENHPASWLPEQVRAPKYTVQSNSKKLLKQEKTWVSNEKSCADLNIYLIWIYLNNCENMCY